jgi:plasmid stabilization system protein ParE
MPYLVRLADRALRDVEAIYDFIDAEASETEKRYGALQTPISDHERVGRASSPGPFLFEDTFAD